MASTNKTTNYDLSQYVGTDKPTYLGDYNSDMLKIDTQMKQNADDIATAISSASTATSTANSANTTAQSALNTAQSANTTAGQANTTAGNAQSTAQSALSTATTANATAQSAEEKADTISGKLNLTNFQTINSSSMSKTGNGGTPNGIIYTATNQDGSIAKIYGQVDIPSNGTTGNIIVPTTLRPKDSNNNPTDLTIIGAVIRSISASGSIKNIGVANLVIRSNGNVELPYTQVNSTNDVNRFTLMAVLLFLQPFNDEPIPEGE